MDTNELKKLVKNSTAVLVLDDGEPSFVILKYDSYKELIFQEPVKEVKINHAGSEKPGFAKNGLSAEEPRADAETEVLERINRDILALKEEIEKEEKTPPID